MFVVFLSNPTFLIIPPSISTSTHAGPLLCTRGYFYDYFSMRIVFLYILLMRINKNISMTSMAVGLCSDNIRKVLFTSVYYRIVSVFHINERSSTTWLRSIATTCSLQQCHKKKKSVHAYSVNLQCQVEEVLCYHQINKCLEHHKSTLGTSRLLPQH